MSSLRPEEWHDLFVAAAGAAAALTGLVFVAVSINIKAILDNPGLPERALGTVLLLLSVAIVSLFGLVPGQSLTALGCELVGEGVALAVTLGLLLNASVKARERDDPTYLASFLGTSLPGTIPLVIGGASLIARGGGGLYWTLAGLIGALVGGVINAWVFLVEILR